MMLKGPLAPNLYQMRVACALLRVSCADAPATLGSAITTPHERAEVTEFAEYLDFEPTAGDVGGAREMLEGEVA
jgi:hypothetical protein